MTVFSREKEPNCRKIDHRYLVPCHLHFATLLYLKLKLQSNERAQNEQLASRKWSGHVAFSAAVSSTYRLPKCRDRAAPTSTGDRLTPLLQRHCRHHWRSAVAVAMDNTVNRCAAPHCRSTQITYNELCPQLRRRLCTAQHGVAQPHHRDWGVYQRHPRLWQRLGQPGNGRLRAGDGHCQWRSGDVVA